MVPREIFSILPTLGLQTGMVEREIEIGHLLDVG